MRLSLRGRSIILACGLAALLGSPPHSSADSGPKPLLVLREGLNGVINEWSGPAKFVLYNDGTVFTETSNETSEGKDEFKYLKTHLSPTEAHSLIRSLGVKQIVGTSERQYGQGEGITWQLIYWGSSRPGEITIIDSLSDAPSKVAKLVRSLESYPKRGTRYLAYDYILRFGGDQGPSIFWPKTWRSIKFAKEMLSGYSAPDTVYEYRLDASHALQLRAMLTKAKTERISVNGYVWHVDLAPAPRLPNDRLWVQNPP